MKAMLELRSSDRMAMDCRSRKMASEWFSLQRLIIDYEGNTRILLRFAEREGGYRHSEEPMDLVS